MCTTATAKVEERGGTLRRSVIPQPSSKGGKSLGKGSHEEDRNTEIVLT